MSALVLACRFVCTYMYSEVLKYSSSITIQLILNSAIVSAYFGSKCNIYCYTTSLSWQFLNQLLLICFLMVSQVLARRLRFQLERASGESSLIDRTGRTLKMEPLTTVGDLERYLLKMVGLILFKNFASWPMKKDYWLIFHG